MYVFMYVCVYVCMRVRVESGVCKYGLKEYSFRALSVKLFVIFKFLKRHAFSKIQLIRILICKLSFTRLYYYNPHYFFGRVENR